MDSQTRREEILAKKAKLAEMRRVRALRDQETKSLKQGVGESSDVGLRDWCFEFT
jgi:dynein intermediate chain